MLEQIGQGGMGTVYRARHRVTGDPVAVKVMSPEAAADPRLRARFGQEFLAASRLRHPNIVQGLACDMGGDRPCLVMELVEGLSLGEVIGRKGRLAEEEALRIVLQIADALGAAHDLNLIHRDVKPDNILITADGVARLTDLGLVKDLSLGTDLTHVNTGLGTAAYVAPEQADNARSADARCDIYSLGATLYHALTGAPPFTGKVRAVVLKQQMLNQFAPPSRLVPTIRPSVDQAVCRALDSNPDNRQPSCREFVTSLTQVSRVAVKVPAPAAPAPAAKGAERRRAHRLSCDAPIRCGAVLNQTDRLGGKILDVSSSGLQVLLPRRFEPGALLTVEILDHEQQSVLHFVVKVCWVKKGTGGRYAMGCAFDQEIGPEDMYVLLGNPNPTAVTFGAA
ncbi:MAG: serine/threonine-protein kinase [Gemmataceae bacterium]